MLYRNGVFLFGELTGNLEGKGEVRERTSMDED